MLETSCLVGATFVSYNVGSAMFWLSFSVVAVQRESCSLAAPRVAALIHACSSFLAIAVIGARPEPVEITFRPSRVARILGADIDPDRMADIFDRLGIGFDREDASRWVCEIPTYRPDLRREIDLVEEIGRICDYNLLPAPQTQPAFTPSPLPTWVAFTDRMRELGMALGYREIITNSLPGISMDSILMFSN